jgi:nicotinamidase-related amidase
MEKKRPMSKEKPFPPITITNTALVIHDMQYDFVSDHLHDPEMQFMVKRTRELIDLAHQIGMPVIYTRVESDQAIRFPRERTPYLSSAGSKRLICEKGSRGAEILDELKPGPSDFVITKVRYSAFYGTPLESLTRIKGIWIFLIVGGSLNRGIEWLARDSLTRDIVNIVIADLTHSGTKEEQEASLANFRSFLGYIIKSDEAKSILSRIGNS